jgi:GH15 family glucan-1,4-alpha-glucosidase
MVWDNLQLDEVALPLVPAWQLDRTDAGTLERVRFGARRADDPVVHNTVGVVDRELGVDTPAGQFWHRFIDDGYGEDAAGGPWRLSDPGSQQTVGRGWPIFAGERGEYELLGGDGGPAARLRAIAESANDGLMIAEQIWDQHAPSGQSGFTRSEGTFSATPLTWSHASSCGWPGRSTPGGRWSGPRSSRASSSARTTDRRGCGGGAAGIPAHQSPRRRTT